MLNLKRIVAIILLITPLTFFGQGKGVHKVNQNDKPITRIKPNFSGKKENKNTGFYFTASIGPTILNADNGNKYKLGFEGNLGLGYQIHDFVGLEAKVGFATLEGKYDMIKSQEVNLFEANINLMINLTNIILGTNSSRKFDIIPHIGIGQVQSKGRVVYNNGKIVSFGYEDYNSANNNNSLVNGQVQVGELYFNPTGGGIKKRIVSGAMPMGVDFCYNFNERIKFHFDYITTYSDTDRLDAVPAGYHYDWFTTLQVRFQMKLSAPRKKVASPCDNLFNDYR